MKPPPEKPNARLANLFALLFGAFLGLALLKFGNPCILEQLVERPTNTLEWVMNSWPVSLAWWLLPGLIVLGFFASSPWTTKTKLAWLPLVWFGWQCLSATHAVSSALTVATLQHFAACLICFYLGLFALATTQNLRLFFTALLGALVIVIAVGWQQHFGGLAETRKYFFAYIYPTMKTVPPEYLKKISSDRIFSTLFYPNALAGVLLLLLPVSLMLVWQTQERLTAGARNLLAGLLGLGGLACLYWSKSKGGWLLMLLLGLVALLRLRFERKVKLILVGSILVVGLAVFALRFAGYFQKGATSVSARGDYWRAAAQTAVANPIFGTGPGTFAIPYAKIKKPESEMARLVHNDYLQQASDSGFVGAIAYLVFVVGSLWMTWRKIAQDDWLKFFVWLGLLGWSLQSFLEFGLYIPALAWTAFALFGWLLGSGNQFDTSRKNR